MPMRQRSLCLAWILVLACCLPAAAQNAQPAAPPAGLGAEQAAQIEAETSPEDLVNLAKVFTIRKDLAAAGAAVEKACTLKPELLEDARRQSPKSWNDFWFSHRAKLRLQKLPENDIAGRVKIAEWLRAGDEVALARQTLLAALEKDKNNPEARALAEKWNLFGGGPIQFDLRPGLKQPLIAADFQDEGVSLAVRKDRAFVILPFSYNPGETRLIINKGLLRAVTDDKKSAMVKGIALLSKDGTLAQDNQPLYERIEAVYKEGEGTSGIEIVCFNTMRPPASRGGGGPARQPEPMSREPQEGTGKAAFIIDVPQGFKSLDCEYRGAPPLHLEASVLLAISGGGKETTQPQRDAIVAVLAQEAGGKQATVASAAVARLAALRSATPEGAQQVPAAQLAAMNQKIDRALVTAITQQDPQTRREAFEALAFSNTPLSTDLLAMLRDNKDAAVGLGILEECAALLAPPVEGQPARPTGGQPVAVPEVITRVSGTLPSVNVPANALMMVAACLASAVPQVQQRAADVLLTNPSQQSLLVLSDASGPTRPLVVDKLAKASSPELKSAMLRLMLLRPDPATLPKMLAAAKDVPVVVKGEDDPLIGSLLAPHSAASLELLLEMLSRADLSAVVNSANLKKAFETIASTQQNSKAIRAALLRLATAQFQPPYEAPVKRGSAVQRPSETSAFEALLVTLATSTDPDTAQAAATALINVGRLTALNEQLRKADARIAQGLIQAFYRNKAMWERESLPIFLASRLSDTDPKTQQLALAALLSGLQTVPAKERWKATLAIKLGVDRAQLVELSGNPEERIAQQATELLIRLTQTRPSEASELANLPDKAARDARLATMEGENAAKAAGPFVCMIYLDVAPTGQQQSLEPGADVERPRFSVPIAGPTVVFQRPGGKLAVLLDSTNIAVTSAGGEPGGGLKINAGPILRAAAESPAAGKENLAGRIDLLPLAEPRETEIKYEQFGMWSGEATIQDQQRPDNQMPLRISGARIVFEPLAPQS